MAISYLGGALVSSGSGSDNAQDVSNVAAAAAGDAVVAWSSTFGRGGNEGRIGNALSYAQIVDVTAASGQRLRVAWKNYAGLSEDSVGWEGSGNAADGMTGGFLVFRGHEASALVDVAITTATGNSTNPNPPAITPVNANCMIMVCAASSVNDNAPGTVTNYTVVFPISNNQTNDASSCAAYRLLSGGAGVSEDPAAFNAWLTGTWAVATIAIRDAAVASGQPYIKRVGGIPNMRSKAPGLRMW